MHFSICGSFKGIPLAFVVSPEKRWDTDSVLGFPRQLVIHPLIATRKYFFMLLILWLHSAKLRFAMVLPCFSPALPGSSTAKSHSAFSGACSESSETSLNVSIVSGFCTTSSCVWWVLIKYINPQNPLGKHAFPPWLPPGSVPVYYVKLHFECHSVSEKMWLGDHQFFY